jgi:Tol biopolymer transport system component
MDADGGNLAQVTNGVGELPRDVSPDGRTLMFQKMTEPGLWEVSLSGGSPVKILDQNAFAWYSPDGRYVVLEVVRDEGGRSRRKLEVIPAEGGAPIRSLDPPQGSWIQWAPSGDAVTYIRVVDGVANIWSQPLTGGQPRQITDFKSGGIADYRWSADGKQLVFRRGDLTTDVVLITNFR